VYIVIAGGGRVGAQTASRVVDEGATATVIENDETTAQDVPQRDSIQVIVGDAISPETYDAVDLETADVFAGLTGDTNANVAACYIAASGGGDLKTIARIGTDDERQYGDHDAIDAVVFPEAAGAENATKLILSSP
jgi:Trk K+ transport system NAD-binding subunit